MHSIGNARETGHRPSGRSCCAQGLVTALLALALAGCGGNGDDDALEQYLDRLARTLSIDPEPISQPQVAMVPSPRELRQETRADKLDVLDFLAISGCAVQITIGKRNSSLGRMARDSQRLLLDLEYLRLAPACIDYQRERGETALAEILQKAWTLRRQQLPVAIYNATLGGSEYREFWKKPAWPAADYPANTGSAVISSLEAINSLASRWLAGDFSADNREFEILLAEVATGDGGALQQALAFQDAGLRAADRMLQQRLDQGPLCAPGYRPAAADILANVIRKFFIGGIQPRAADLNRRFHNLIPPVTALEQTLYNAVPAPYQAWRKRRTSQLEEWTAAPSRHVGKLQAVQRPCDSDNSAAG